jgi:hypothetical protein
MPKYSSIWHQIELWIAYKRYIKKYGKEPPEDGALSIYDEGGELTEVEDERDMEHNQ